MPSSGKLPRYSVKSGKVSLSIEPTKARGISTAAVTVAIPLKTNQWVLDALCCGKDPLSTKQLDESVIAYSAYRVAYSKLTGATKSAIQSGASSIKCSSQGDEFQICATVPGKISAARKAAGLIVSSFKFGSLYSKYSSKCKTIGVKPDHSAFDKAVDAANSALGSISVVVTGRVNVSRKDIAEKAAETIARKLKISEGKGKGSSRSVDTKAGPEDSYLSIDAPGLEGVAVNGYIVSNSTEHVILSGGKLWVPLSMKSKLAGLASSDRIKKYVSSIASTAKDELAGALVYLGSSLSLVNSKYLDVSKSVSESSLVSAIGKALHLR